MWATTHCWLLNLDLNVLEILGNGLCPWGGRQRTPRPRVRNGRNGVAAEGWRPPRVACVPRKAIPRKNGFPRLGVDTFAAFSMVSAISDLDFNLCSKSGPNSCRFVSGKCSCAIEASSGITFFNTNSLRFTLMEADASPASSKECFTHDKKPLMLDLSS